MLIFFTTTLDSEDYRIELHFSLLFNSGELLFSRASLLEFTVVLSDTQFTWNSAVEIARGVGKVAAAAAALIDH